MAGANEAQENLRRINEITPAKNVSCKHPVSTPFESKTKSSRHTEKEDVHSTSPVTPTESVSESEEDILFATSPCSPNSSFLSQEAPVITWDYSSLPKHPDGKPMENWNVTLEDISRVLSATKKAFRENPHVVSPVSHSTSSHSKLVQEWFSKGYTVNIPPDPPPKPKVKKSIEKKASEESFLEVIKFFETFGSKDFRKNKADKAKSKQETPTAEENVQPTDAIAQESNSSSSVAENELTLKASVHKENDSIDELWGDDLTNESFIIEASQFSVNLEDEISNFSTEVATPEMVPVVTSDSSVSEAMLYQKNCNSPKSDKFITPFEGIGAELSRCDVFDRSEKTNQKNLFCKKSVLSSKPCVKVSTTARSLLPDFSSSSCSLRGEESHIGITVDYAEGCPTENICEQLPFGVYSVRKDKEKYTFCKRMNSDSVLSKKKELHNLGDSLSEARGFGMSSSQGARTDTLRKKQSSQGSMYNNSKNCIQNSALAVEHNCDTSSAKAAANNVDNVFESFDDPLVLEPEMWSWVNEVESHASSQVKCSPEEIALKKAAALKRRKKKQLLKEATNNKK